MQIALVRHGRPTYDPSRIPAERFEGWVDAYDRAGIDPALPPPQRVRAIAAKAGFSLSSDLPRAVESLQTLVAEPDAPPERLFREAALPPLPSTPVRLDPQLWAVAARIGWLLGWSGGVESAPRARRRAHAAGERLADLAEAHGSVLLVGHGIFNALIAWELRARGWRGPIWPTGSYWSCAVYRKGRD